MTKAPGPGNRPPGVFFAHSPGPLDPLPLSDSAPVTNGAPGLLLYPRCRMRRLTLCLALSLCLCGCWLVEKQTIPLSPQVIAAVEAELGPIDRASPEAVRAAVEKILQVQVDSVQADGANSTATLPEAGLEMAEEGTSTLIGKVLENPTPYGLGLAGLAALAAVLKVYLKRKGLRTGTKPPEAGGAK